MDKFTKGVLIGGIASGILTTYIKDFVDSYLFESSTNKINSFDSHTIPKQLNFNSTDYVVQPDTVNTENYNLIKLK